MKRRPHYPPTLPLQVVTLTPLSEALWLNMLMSGMAGFLAVNIVLGALWVLRRRSGGSVGARMRLGVARRRPPLCRSGPSCTCWRLAGADAVPGLPFPCAPVPLCPSLTPSLNSLNVLLW